MIRVFLILIFFFIPLLSQVPVHEEIKVDWWVVPLFAIDPQGQSVDDLKAGHLELVINGQGVSDFSIYKRSFYMAKKADLPVRPPAAEKRKMVFLLFDLAFSSLENLERSKKVAESIIENASESCLFSVFTMDPYGGLTYLAGPGNKNSEIIKIIESRVILNTNAKNIETLYDLCRMAQSSGVKGSKYTSSEMQFLLEDKSHSLKNTNRKFFQSFESLYYALSMVRDNKFIYFFSEGISLFARKVIRHDEGEYRNLIQQTADYLGRSGAVLFVVNPAGALESFSDMGSGEDILRNLAQESGGKYLEGDQKTLSHRIHNLHRAYYEIAFPERSSFRGKVRKVVIRSLRPGVRIHTLHSLEKRKSYEDLNEIEQEVFAVNLVNRNPLYSRGINLMDVKVRRKRKEKGREIYQISLPESWIHNEMDIFKVRIEEIGDDIKVSKSTFIPRNREMNIEFELSHKGRNYFVLYNLQEQSALVQGIEIPGIENPVVEKIPEVKAMRDDFKYSPELSGVLSGAADYCEELKKAGFHYYCQEKVVQTLSFFIDSSVENVVSFQNRGSQHDMIERSQLPAGQMRRKVDTYLFDYQIIRKGNGIKEQRKLVSQRGKLVKNEGSGLHLQAFLSEKAVFSPVTLFARERQLLYEYRYLGKENVKGHTCALIEIVPRRKKDAQFVYGQVWLDQSNQSILKIKVNPRSIGGYTQLKQIAKKYHSKLSLSMEIYFGVVNGGIRFPSRIILSEKYKGGRVVYRDNRGKQRHRRFGSKGWERNRTEYTYKNYRFFTVDTKVSAE